MNEHIEPTVSVKQAEQIAGVCRRTIYNWMNAGRLRFKRTAGGSVRIYPSSLFREDTKSADASTLRNTA